jgi:hypothetical protein
MNWDDDDFMPPMVTPAKAPPPKPSKTAEVAAQEAAELRLIGDLVGGAGEILTPAVTGVVVEPAALRAYGETVCRHLHVAATSPIPRRHLVEFYRAVAENAGRTLGSQELQGLITTLTIAQQAAVRAAAKHKTKKAVGPKIRIGSEMDVDD